MNWVSCRFPLTKAPGPRAVIISYLPPPINNLVQMIVGSFTIIYDDVLDALECAFDIHASCRQLTQEGNESGVAHVDGDRAAVRHSGVEREAVGQGEDQFDPFGPFYRGPAGSKEEAGGDAVLDELLDVVDVLGGVCLFLFGALAAALFRHDAPGPSLSGRRLRDDPYAQVDAAAVVPPCVI